MPHASCNDCEHLPVCALRKAFVTPVKKLAAAKTHDSDDDAADHLANVADLVSTLVYGVCPSAN